MTKVFDSKLTIELGPHCEEPWERMSKLSQARWCEKCQRKLHDFADMTPEEILTLLDRNPERVCARVETDGNGHVRTRATAAGLILTAALTLPTTLAAQNQAPPQQAGTTQSAGTQQPRGTGVYGVVSDAGRPLGGVNVAATASDDRGRASTVVTAADGSYSFTNRAPGSYGLSFYGPPLSDSSSGSQRWDLAVQVCPGTMLMKDTTRPKRFLGVVVRPPRPGQPPRPEHSSWADAGQQGIKGRLTTSAGEAIPGGKVVAVQVANRDSHSATTDQSGGFSLAGLQPGDYSITFSAPGFASQTVSGLQVVNGYSRLQDAQLCPAPRR